MIFRAATSSDVDALVDIQERGAVRALAHIFPQDRHPFPRAAVAQRWRAEIGDPGTDVYIVTNDAGAITGFAATRGCELLHFGTSVGTWGTGLAQQLHDVVVNTLIRARAVENGRIRLRVFEANTRARRFYEKLGWSETKGRTRSQFAPYPVLVEYQLVVTSIEG